MEREAVEAAIRAAFAGVRLGSGLSLRQSPPADARGAGLTEAEFDAGAARQSYAAPRPCPECRASHSSTYRQYRSCSGVMPAAAASSS